MKNILSSILALTLAVFIISTDNARCQDEDYDYSELEKEDDGFLPMRAVYANLGYGPSSLSFGFGGRYEFLGFQMSVTGIVNDIPNYSHQRATDANGGTKDYAALVVSLDGFYYYDLDDYYMGLSAFGNIGYYSQIDTVLTVDVDTDGDRSYYLHGTKKSAGIAFGLGLQYLYEERWIFGLGYHNKNGIFAQVGISW